MKQMCWNELRSTSGLVFLEVLSGKVGKIGKIGPEKFCNFLDFVGFGVLQKYDFQPC